VIVMFKWSLFAAVLLMAMPANAAECRLSHEECLIIEREIIMNDIQQRRDYELLSSLSPFERGLKVIELKYARIRERVKRLPKHIAAELVRIYKCESEMQLIAAKGEGEPSPECR